MPQHYLTITQCQNLLKNIKVLNSITPTLITQCVTQPTYQPPPPETKLNAEQIQGLQNLHAMWQDSRPRSERVDESNDTSIETRSDLSSVNDHNNEEQEQAKLDLILNPKNHHGEDIDQQMQTEQIILQTKLVQIDEVSHSSQASSSQFPSRAHSRQQTLSKQQFSLNLNQCQVLDCGNSSSQHISTQSYLNIDLKN